MPALIGAAVGTNLTLRIYKKLFTNPAIVWSNTYEFEVQDTPPGEVDLTDLIARWTGFEAPLHLEEVLFDRAVLSSWVPDGEPYDPTTFMTVPLEGGGSRTFTGQPQPLHIVAFVRRVTAFGQNGKLFYRRALTEDDVIAPAGTPTFQSGSNFPSDLAAASISVAGDLAGSTGFMAVMKSALPIQRQVSEFVAAGVRVVQYNNRYYDVP